MLEIIKYIVLGIIQGITEIFPVSSSGHLTIFSHLFNIDLDHLTVFLMITNTGSFLALLIYFRKKISTLITSNFKFIFKREDNFKPDFEYALKLIIAVIPIGIFGLIFKDALKNDLLTVGFSLLVTSGLLFFVYKTKDIQWKNQISYKNALIMGTFQMFAIFPGISRSGITMSGGLIQKIDLKKVLDFSFLSYILVSIPVMILGFYEAADVNESIHILGYSLAFIMSFIFSYLAVKVLYRFVKIKNLLHLILSLLI